PLAVEGVAPGWTRYYRARGSWAGAAWLLAGWLRPPLDRLVVADAAGVVVADTEGSAVGQSATAARLDTGVPLRVRGQQVGTLYATLSSGPAAFIPRPGGEGRLGARAPGRDPRAVGAAPTHAGDAEETEAAGRAAEGLARRPLGLPPFGIGGRPGLAPLPSIEAGFLERVNRAFLVAALAAAALAGLLSLLLARQITRPLRELADGARRI